jgi:lipoprotein-releasing system permease protein
MRVVLMLALRQLWARKLLNGIAIAGVMLGVATLIGMSSIMLGFRQKFLDNMLRISPHVTVYDRQLRPEPPLLARSEPTLVATAVSHEVPSDRDLRIERPTELARALERMDGVVAASPAIAGSAVVSFGAKELPVEVRGVEPASQERVTPISPYLVAGRWASFQASSDGVLLGSGVARRIGARLGDVVHLGSPRATTQTFEVVGLFDTGLPPVDNARVYLTLRNAQVLLGRPDAVARLELRLADETRAPAIADRVEALSGYDAESWQEANANSLGLFHMQDKIVGFVIGSLLTVGGFGILAIQIMIVLQKTRDISILRSVGFRRRDILALFLLQGGIVASIGGAVGASVGWLFCRWLETVHVHVESFVKADGFVLADSPRLYLLGCAFALAVGLMASLLPALRASRVEPVDVLRGQIG